MVLWHLGTNGKILGSSIPQSLIQYPSPVTSSPCQVHCQFTTGNRTISIYKSDSCPGIPGQSAQEFRKLDIHKTVQDVLGNPGTILGQSAMPSMPMDCQLPAMVTLIPTRMSMDCQLLGYCHANCHLHVSAPESTNVTVVSVVFKVCIPCIVPFNRARFVHSCRTLIVCIY
jgi:hypothetical protein